MNNTRKFTNPYISKANLYPEQLINDLGEGLSNQQLEYISDQIAQHKNTYLEIGSGSGGFLIQMAMSDPLSLFIGIELRYKRSVRTIEKARQQGISNLIIIRADANHVFEHFKPGCLSGIYVNFPDPWDKKRWFKHRILNDDNLKRFKKFLILEGRLSFKTDHQEYYQWSKNIIDKQTGWQLTEMSDDLHNSPYNQADLSSEFEQLFRSQKKNIYYLCAKRV